MTKAPFILLAVLTLGACAAPPIATVPYYRIPPGPPEPPPHAATAGNNGVLPSSDNFTPIPGLGPLIAPSAPGDYGRAPATTMPAPAMPRAAAPGNAGPVTGFGAGGMQQPPGAPPNPPYTGAGLRTGQ
jgi:hypothetical protein